jgi:hypothetical protein
MLHYWILYETELEDLKSSSEVAKGPCSMEKRALNLKLKLQTFKNFNRIIDWSPLTVAVRLKMTLDSGVWTN